MRDNLLIVELMEEALKSGRSPEDVCAGRPELLPEVRERLARFRRVRDELDAIFPEPGSTGAGAIAVPRPGGPMPRIPGHVIEAAIGWGGMGVVYKAYHLRLNRPVAVKMMLAGGYAGPLELVRFLSEAEALGEIGHPNVVQVHDVGDVDGLPYFTMEYVEGGNLAQKMAGSPQPARQAAALVAVLAGAVHAAHQVGIIHRDLKPANVLLTADGTPKISDFGLSRRLGASAGLTRTGSRAGTPSYMAPEQAIGKAAAIGTPADVYSLGAILYEALTGRPPFQAETAMETERQVVTDEPVPPSRLCPKVPADLETICLKCLHKSPQRRYATASCLAEDLDRFIRGEPIEARPVGLPERFVKWVRRRPTLALVLASCVLMATSLIGGGLWLLSEQAATMRDAEADISEAESFQRLSSWREADAALHRARVRMGNRPPAGLHRRESRASRHQALIARLEAIRQKRTVRVTKAGGYWEGEYEGVFREAGRFKVGDDPEVVAEWIRTSFVSVALLAALDDWALCVSYRNDARRETWLLEVARRADPDRAGWRDRFRDRATRKSREGLARLAESANMAETPVNLLAALGELLNRSGGDAIPFMTKVQQRHPNDLWSNWLLGHYHHMGGDRVAAIRYYQAALAIRPGIPDLIDNLSIASREIGRLEESLYYSQETVRLAPDDPRFRETFARNLLEAGRAPEALDRFQEGLSLQPDQNLRSKLLRGVIESMARMGCLEEASTTWRKALEDGPTEHGDWDGYAELCLFLGREEEYRRVRRVLLDRFGEAEDLTIAEKTGRACLLLPARHEDLQKATALIDRILADEGTKESQSYRYCLFAKGLAEYRNDRLQSSISILTGPPKPELEPGSRLVVALAGHRLGREQEALKSLAAAVLPGDWLPGRATTREDWSFHVLLREAEALMLLNTAKILRGDYQPRSQDERIAYLGACQSKGLYRTAAGLYAKVFAVDPKLADDLNSRNRFKAALTAALVGSGQGEDGIVNDELERARWRKQARDWLWADLALLRELSERNDSGIRRFLPFVQKEWTSAAELAGIRDQAEIEKLAPGERQECMRLWSELDSLAKRVGESQ